MPKRMAPAEKVAALEDALATYRREMEEHKAQFNATVNDILRRAQERKKREAEEAGLFFIPTPNIEFTPSGFEFRHVSGWKESEGKDRPPFVPEKIWVVCKKCGADFVAKEHPTVWEQGAFWVSTGRSIAVTCKSCDRISNYLTEDIPGWPGRVIFHPE
ncbi:MAG TPA: hypothetical protein VLC46_09795 [Thermoanaerobaculia bacterium]|jgi:hypothetical protein|nr:hypothetical protein [Thermoanaerobaculia bacterium]